MLVKRQYTITNKIIQTVPPFTYSKNRSVLKKLYYHCHYRNNTLQTTNQLNIMTFFYLFVANAQLTNQFAFLLYVFLIHSRVLFEHTARFFWNFYHVHKRSLYNPLLCITLFFFRLVKPQEKSKKKHLFHTARRVGHQNRVKG